MCFSFIFYFRKQFLLSQDYATKWFISPSGAPSARQKGCRLPVSLRIVLSPARSSAGGRAPDSSGNPLPPARGQRLERLAGYGAQNTKLQGAFLLAIISSSPWVV